MCLDLSTPKPQKEVAPIRKPSVGGKGPCPPCGGSNSNNKRLPSGSLFQAGGKGPRPPCGGSNSNNKRLPSGSLFQAGGKGFEPLLTDPESAVLPLDEPPICQRGLFYHALREKSNLRGYLRAARRVLSSISMNISRILATACRPMK